MVKNDKLAVNQLVKKFYDIAEKIVEGLLERGYMEEVPSSKGVVKITFRKTNYTDDGITLKKKLIEEISEAIKRNLTYGNLGTLTLRNNKGEIVAKLYMLPDGTLADDSFVCNEGWKH